MAELILFGNAGQNGQVRALDLYRFEPDRPGMACGERSAGATRVDPVSVDLEFPLVHTDLGTGFGLNGGNGFGLDVGATLETGTWTLAAVVQNVVNSFAWDLSALQYRPLSVHST